VKRSEISKVITIGLHAPRVTTFRRLMIFCTASITGSAAWNLDGKPLSH